jgi:hypothetical protein
MACIEGDVFVQKMLASSQGAHVDVDGEGDGSGVGERRERAEPRVGPRYPRGIVSLFIGSPG